MSDVPQPDDAYEPSLASLESGANDPDAAAVVQPEPPDKPRITFAILVPILAIIAATLVSIVVAGAGLILMTGGAALDPNEVQEELGSLFKQPWALPLLLIPGQLVFGLAALGAAWLSPLPVSKRLDLKPGTMPKWTWIVMAAASPAAVLPMALLLHFFPIEPSEHLTMLAEMMMEQSGVMLLVTGALISIAPGIVEEALFRGYMQSRLLRRLPVAVAIGLSAFIFAIAHLDPLHALGVFPLGIWLGLVAWRSGSVFPAMLGHFFNNLLSFVGAQFAEDVETTQLTATDIPVFALLMALMAFSLYLMFWRRESVGASCSR